MRLHLAELSVLWMNQGCGEELDMWLDVVCSHGQASCYEPDSHSCG